MKATHLFIPLLIQVMLISCRGQGPSTEFMSPMDLRDVKGKKARKSERLEELMKTYADYGNFNGSVLVADQGEIIYKNGFGFANMEWDIPNKPDTKHRLASITKQFTAMLIMQLVEEGKLALGVPISTYLPNYPKKNGDQITIHQLLTHSAGVPDYGGFSNYRDFEREWHSPEKIIKLFADLPLQFTPGSQFTYSNSGYVILGVIIEKLTGKSFSEVLQEKILDPLEMKNTGHDDQRRILKNRASGYYHRWGVFRNSAFLDMSLPYAAGALYSTVIDLHLWDQALYTNKLLSREYRELLFHPHIPANGSHYGYGWFINENFSNKNDQRIQTVSHGGGMDGFRTRITRIPIRDACIVLLDNTESGYLSEITYAIARIIFDLPYDLPEQSVAQSLRKMINSEGLEEGVDHFRRVKLAKGYHLAEEEMIVLGYDFLRADRAEEAAVVFKLSVEAFPESFNVYDSYAEALTILGKKEEAIQNYVKSLEINPGNQNGLKMLEKLGMRTDRLVHQVPLQHLKLLSGAYVAVNQRTSKDEDWTIEIDAVDNVLTCYDKGRRYEVMPLTDNEFVNQDFGVTITFDCSDKNEVTLLLYGSVKFNKVDNL